MAAAESGSNAGGSSGSPPTLLAIEPLSPDKPPMLFLERGSAEILARRALSVEQAPSSLERLDAGWDALIEVQNLCRDAVLLALKQLETRLEARNLED